MKSVFNHNAIIERQKRLVEMREQRKLKSDESRKRREAERAAEWKKHLKTYRPCPFCGSVNVYFVNNGGMGGDWVACNDCNATGPASTGREEAIKNWNEGK